MKCTAEVCEQAEVCMIWRTHSPSHCPERDPLTPEERKAASDAFKVGSGLRFDPDAEQ